MASERSLTMNGEEALAIGMNHPSFREAALAVARETERRLIERIRAVPLDDLLREVYAIQFAENCTLTENNVAELVREALLAALTEDANA
jgi:hypothetical protein